MLTRVLFAVLFTFCLSNMGFAQAQITHDQTKQVHELSKRISESNANIYTVLLYDGSSPIAADSLIDVFIAQYPDLQKPRLTLNPPNYGAKVGCFIVKLEAVQLLNKIKSTFPDAIVVPASDCQ